MFTGLIEHAGKILAREAVGGGLRLVVDLGPLAAGSGLGDSICVAGCCLTVAALEAGRATFELSPETLSLTRFGTLRPGDQLNLERSLKLGDRMGGHLVTGHVDGLGTLVGARRDGDYMVQEFAAPSGFAAYLVTKGSVAVDGVSLTVATLTADERFSVALIPETLARTTLAVLEPGDRVHLEGDLLGKYVARQLELRAGTHRGPAPEA
ncbi:MAG TPA: riboflavin synthase [Planctomycetota bacterium]